MSEGIVYILINEAMPGYTKIGKTTSSVEQRMKELDSTGVPLPFECFYAARVANIDSVERKLHDAFLDRRIRPRREFFEIDPERVRSALSLAALDDATPKNDVVENPDDQDALDKARINRGHFNFEMVKIEPGATLTFTRDPSVTCTVVDRKKVEFEGEKTSVSAAALKLVHKLGYSWSTIHDAIYRRSAVSGHGVPLGRRHAPVEFPRC